jgi:hypothetical protein
MAYRLGESGIRRSFPQLHQTPLSEPENVRPSPRYSLLTRDALTTGDVTFSVSTDDGQAFTFRVIVPADWIDLYPLYFIGVVPVAGGYKNLGIIHPDGQVRRTAGSAFAESSPELAVARRVIHEAWREAVDADWPIIGGQG